MNITKFLDELIKKYKLICLEGTNCVGKNFLYENFIDKYREKMSIYKTFRSVWDGYASPKGRKARHWLDFDMTQAPNLTLDFFAQLDIDGNLPSKTILMDRGFLSSWSYILYKKQYISKPLKETPEFSGRLKEFHRLLRKHNGNILLLVASQETLLKHREEKIKGGLFVPSVLQMFSCQKHMVHLMRDHQIEDAEIYKVTSMGDYKKISFQQAINLVEYDLPKANKMQKSQIYLAGPFFNQEQKKLISSLENLLEAEKFVVHSPSRDGTVIKKDDGKEALKEVFDWNLEKMREADVIVAVVDYVGVKLKAQFGDTSKEISVPDTGTVWEMGYTYALQKPIVGYSPTGEKNMNLMLTIGVDLYCDSEEKLTKALEELQVLIIDKKYGFDKHNDKLFEKLREKYAYKNLVH
jgi:nucleoside 2-deoxyribosyltransferase/thymidylate kinase